MTHHQRSPRADLLRVLHMLHVLQVLSQSHGRPMPRAERNFYHTLTAGATSPTLSARYALGLILFLILRPEPPAPLRCFQYVGVNYLPNH